MKTLRFTVNAHLGMDCMFCSHDEFEYFEVELKHIGCDVYLHHAHEVLKMR